MDSTEGERSWTGYVVPAVVTLLLGIQFFLGFQGFDEPHGGLLGLLEAPGALLGWGGVVVLAVLLGWLIAGLVGRDLFGLQGPSGLVVRLVGCVALGFAVSGVVGLLGGAAAGGEVGAGIGRLLQGTLGTVPGLVLLVLMAIPALVLAISPFFTTGPATGRPGDPVSRDALAELEPKPGLYEGGTHQPKPLYPPRRFDEDGHEIPMSFDGRDVGPVRYADEEPEEGARPAVIKPDPVPMRDDEALADGVRFADEGDSDDEPGSDAPSAPEGVEAGDGRIPLADGVRYADEEAGLDDDEPAEDVEEADADEEADDDEEAEAEPGEEDEDEEKVEEEPIVRAPSPEAPRVVPAPLTRGAPPQVRGADALEQLQDEDEGAHYRAKLEGSGIFDEPSAPPPPEAPSEDDEEDEEDEVEAKPTRKAAGRKKKAAPKKKTAKKPAAKKKAPAKKKATPKKKAATAKKKATPKKKAGPKKKAAAAKTKPAPKKKAPPKKKTVKKEAPPKAPPAEPAPAPEIEPEREETPPVMAPPRRKGAGAKGPEDAIYRKAVEVAMERRAASSVLLSRRLGIGYAQARALIELLVQDGILGEMAPSGSRPLLVTEEEWEARKG